MHFWEQKYTPKNETAIKETEVDDSRIGNTIKVQNIQDISEEKVQQQ